MVCKRRLATGAQTLRTNRCWGSSISAPKDSLGTCHRLPFTEGDMARQVIHRSEYVGSLLALAFYGFGSTKTGDESQETR
jgi:hypothetical protein